ncbi:MAG TPA: GAF domain-containing protein, partial [Anaerolineae bacterium]|nr:GAF domain-containing protein [Anaerolineae bacterium]
SHPVDKGIIGHVVTSGQAQIVNDVQSDPHWDRRLDHESGFITRRILCVPMISRDRVIGAIEVLNHRDGRPFEEEEAALLTSLAAQAAVAIENARLYTLTDQALARRVQELSTMQRIDRDLNAALDFDRVMDVTVDWALRATRVSVGLIAFYHQEHHGLLLLASRGYPPDVERYREQLWPLDEGIVGRVVRSGQPALVGNVLQDPDYRAAQPSTRSQLSVPIRREERVIGVIALESPELDGFDDEDLVFVQRLADHAVIAIENARLHADTERHLQQQVALRAAGEVISSALDLKVVMSRIVEQMGHVVQATSAYICEHEPETRASTVIAEYISPEACPEEVVSDMGTTYYEEDNTFYQLLQSRGYAVAHVNDPGLDVQDRVHMEHYGAKTVLSIPFVVRGRLVGFAELWESRRPRQFRPDEIALCQGIAGQAAIAIENARLYDESRQRAEDMALLYDISLAISSHLSLGDVLEALHVRIRDVWDPPVFFIALYDEALDALEFPIYLDRGTRLEPIRLDLAEQSCLAASIVRNRRPLLIRDRLAEAESDPAQDALLGEPTRSWLGVPLVAGDRMVGVMSVQDYAPGAYGEEHERFLTTIASQVSIAIENAQLYQRTEHYARELAERAERLALINRISVAVNSTLDLDEILGTATREIARAFQVKQAGTFLADEEEDLLRLVAEHWEGDDTGTTRVAFPLSTASSLEQVIETSQAVFIADPQHDPVMAGVRSILLRRRLHSLLIVPLVVKGRVIGVIELGGVDEARTFTTDEIDLAQTIANQVGMAVENVRLYQETQRRLREVSLLYDTSAAVSRTLDLERVLQTTVDQITAALDADGCTISIWDHEEDTLATQISYSLDPACWEPESVGSVYSLAEQPVPRRVLAGRQPLGVRSGDVAADPEAAAWLASLRARSALLVPMIVRDKAIGLLELVRAASGRAFTATEIRLCHTLANQAAAAIENARLYEGVREADQAKSEFIDFVAHELKQPMTAMQGYSKLLIMGIGGELTTNQRQFVDVINSNVDRMGKLVNDLLEISRLEAGRTKLKLAPVRLQ